MKSKARVILFFVILVSIIGAFFAFPRGIGGKVRAWRLGLDLVGGAHLVYEIDMANVSSGDRESVANGLRDVIERRVNLFGVSEPQVVIAKTGGAYRLNVDLAGAKDIGEAIKQIGETPFLFFAEVEENKEKPEESKFLPTELTGRYVKSAQPGFNQTTGQPEIYLEFNDEGAKLFEEITARNVGKPVAIFLDNQLLTAPVVNEKISGGRAQITGQFTPKEAKKLVERFNAGALPAPIHLISQETVGASLGLHSLEQMLRAGLIGTILIILFMMLYYRTLGIYSSLALIIYTVLSLSIFKLFSVTMTLAGIAGFILSIGMAVDANILIFARVKEEKKRGAVGSSAIEEGFKRAWLAIRDSNVTTLLTTVILYYFSTGFVRGFALTLMLGVLVSMFSAITVTRTMLRAFAKE